MALGILAVGLLAVAAAQVYAMQSGRSSRHTTQADTIARQQLELFRNLPFDHALLAASDWTPDPALPVDAVVQSDPNDVVEQSYGVQWRIANLNAPGTLKSLDVRVVWDEPNRPGRNLTVSTILFDE